MEGLSEIDMKHLLNHQQVYSDSIMSKWAKAELVKGVRMCEKNINALSERTLLEEVKNQYKLLLNYSKEC